MPILILCVLHTTFAVDFVLVLALLPVFLKGTFFIVTNAMIVTLWCCCHLFHKNELYNMTEKHLFYNIAEIKVDYCTMALLSLKRVYRCLAQS